MKKNIVLLIIFIFVGILVSLLIINNSNYGIKADVLDDAISGWTGDSSWSDYEPVEDATFNEGDSDSSQIGGDSSYNEPVVVEGEDVYEAKDQANLNSIKENYYQNTGTKWEDLSFDEQTAILRDNSNLAAARTQATINAYDSLKYDSSVTNVLGDISSMGGLSGITGDNSSGDVSGMGGFTAMLDSSSNIINEITKLGLGTDFNDSEKLTTAINNEINKTASDTVKKALNNIKDNIASGKITTTEAVKALEKLASTKDGIGDSTAGASSFTKVSAPNLPDYSSGSWSDLGSRIIKLLAQIAGTALIIMLLVGGVMYITSAGNDEQAGKAKSVLINAIIGIVVVALAWTIVSFVFTKLGESGSSASSLNSSSNSTNTTSNSNDNTNSNGTTNNQSTSSQSTDGSNSSTSTNTPTFTDSASQENYSRCVEICDRSYEEMKQNYGCNTYITQGDTSAFNDCLEHFGITKTYNSCIELCKQKIETNWYNQ